MVTNRSNKETDITVYGATSFVAKHVIRYLVEVANAKAGSQQPYRITLGGRSAEKLKAIQDQFPEGRGIIRDTFVAGGSDLPRLKEMAKRTAVVINCVGPYYKYSSSVVEACADVGTDYVDITGEAFWVANMRQKFGKLSQKSGARIISLCGFDSIPTDLSVFAAVEALKERSVSTPGVQIQEAKVWHQMFGLPNGGTIHTAVDFEFNPRHDFTLPSSGNQFKLRPMPFLMGDPLQLAHPEKVRHNPSYDATRNRFAKGEWLNQLASIDTNFVFGVSLAMPMATINMKVLQASAVALKYGPNIEVRERFVPLGYFLTRIVGIFALVPMLCLQFFIMCLVLFLKTPYVGKKAMDIIAPPGSGVPDSMVYVGSNAVYATVTAETKPGEDESKVDRGYAYLEFKGDAGNAVTAQCVCEAALSLLLDRDNLPPRSEDGFGTPAELLGPVLLKRFRETPVRPVVVKTEAKTRVAKNELRLHM